MTQTCQHFFSRTDSYPRYEQLKAYSDREGHAMPPHKFKTDDGFMLGYWVKNKRRSKDSLTAEQRQQLEALDGWSWKKIVK